MLSEEESKKIKEKLISHIQKTFPEEQVNSAIEQIEKMNSEELENFLEKNKIITKNPDECVFCSIVSGAINSVKIEEDENGIAVLDINPISKGQTLLIPKKHTDSAEVLSSLSKKVEEKIKKKFNPKKIETSTSKLFGHETLNLLPVYDDENFDSEKKHTEIEELKKIKEELEKKEEVPIPEPVEEKKEEFLWLPKRIP